MVLLGQCSGALVAWELAHRFRPAPSGPLRGVVVLSRVAPDRPVPVPDPELPDDEFLAAVTRMGGIPADLLGEPALLALLLPAVRADFALVRDYHTRPAGPLDVPVVVVAGTRDTWCTDSDLRGWLSSCTAGGRLARVRGGHFLLHESPAAIAAEIGHLIDPAALETASTPSPKGASPC
jgi:medium-chain acyl-[acyl-carrier-protein] hydrolase